MPLPLPLRLMAGQQVMPGRQGILPTLQDVFPNPQGGLRVSVGPPVPYKGEIYEKINNMYGQGDRKNDNDWWNN